MIKSELLQAILERISKLERAVIDLTEYLLEWGKINRETYDRVIELIE